jgi:hypothetical protein
VFYKEKRETRRVIVKKEEKEEEKGKVCGKKKINKIRRVKERREKNKK